VTTSDLLPHALLCDFPYRECIGECRTVETHWDRSAYSSELAYRLWVLTLDNNHDAEWGDAEVCDTGWYALFRAERAIYAVTLLGEVIAWRVDAEDIDAAWSRVGHIDYPHHSGAMLGDCRGCDWDHQDCSCDYCTGYLAEENL
jgi:hypothetical protein